MVLAVSVTVFLVSVVAESVVVPDTELRLSLAATELLSFTESAILILVVVASDSSKNDAGYSLCR